MAYRMFSSISLIVVCTDVGCCVWCVPCFVSCEMNGFEAGSPESKSRLQSSMHCERLLKNRTLFVCGLSINCKRATFAGKFMHRGVADTYLDLRAVSSPRQFDGPVGAIGLMSTNNSTSDSFGMGAATKSRNITLLSPRMRVMGGGVRSMQQSPLPMERLKGQRW